MPPSHLITLKRGILFVKMSFLLKIHPFHNINPQTTVCNGHINSITAVKSQLSGKFSRLILAQEAVFEFRSYLLKKLR
jgi:hypothetical protein